jgi:hypothetical protein
VGNEQANDKEIASDEHEVWREQQRNRPWRPIGLWDVEAHTFRRNTSPPFSGSKNTPSNEAVLCLLCASFWFLAWPILRHWKMETCPPVTSTVFQRTTRRYIQEGRILHSKCNILAIKRRLENGETLTRHAMYIADNGNPRTRAKTLRMRSQWVLLPGFPLLLSVAASRTISSNTVNTAGTNKARGGSGLNF